jgi:hypothetical protein
VVDIFLTLIVAIVLSNAVGPERTSCRSSGPVGVRAHSLKLDACGRGPNRRSIDRLLSDGSSMSPFEIATPEAPSFVIRDAWSLCDRSVPARSKQ